MTLKYESELLFELMKRDGDDAPSDVLPYESELKEKYLEQVEGAYPKLQDYRSEWLNYNLYHRLPSDFPGESVTNVTNATFENVVPYAYKSAILKGQTKIIDELGNECELPNSPKVTKGAWINTVTGEETASEASFNTSFLKCPLVSFIVKGNNKYKRVVFYDVNKNFISGIDSHTADNSNVSIDLRNIPSTAVYMRISASTSATGTYTPNTILLIEDKNGNNLYTTHLESVKMPVLTTSNEDGTKTNILTVNEDVTLRSNGNICDELNLLTGQLTQRIDEDGEVLSQEVVKTVDLTVTDQDGNTKSIIIPIEGTMHVSTSSQTLPPLLDMSVPVEATSQNLMSFANIVEEEK